MSKYNNHKNKLKNQKKKPRFINLNANKHYPKKNKKKEWRAHILWVYMSLSCYMIASQNEEFL